jgi:superfamily II DNA or RNA helicase
MTDNFVVTHNTYILIGIMKALPPNTPILFLCNRKGLVLQNYKEIMGWGFDRVGRFDGDVHEPNLITCATSQSAMKLGKLLTMFRALIVDEVHMMMNPTAMKIYKKLTGCEVRIGLSATPFKHGGTDLVHKYGVKGFFGPILLTSVTESGKLTTNFLQEERHDLSPSKCFFYYVDEPQIPHDIYIDAVTNGIAQNWHFHQMVARLTKKLTGRTLILVERLAHGDTLNNLIPGSLWVQGKDNEDSRSHVIKQLTEATGNVVAIATKGIFSAGINVFLHNLINAGGGKAEHDVIQGMGRGLRTCDDKSVLHYYDFIFRINEYLEDHSWERIQILKKEKHEVNIMEQINF